MEYAESAFSGTLQKCVLLEEIEKKCKDLLGELKKGQNKVEETGVWVTRDLAGLFDDALISVEGRW